MEISALPNEPDQDSKADDIARITQWYFDEWISKVADVTLDKVQSKIESNAADCELPFNLVAHIDGELVATLELKLTENKSYPSYEHWIGGVFVSNQYRGQGIAKSLISRAQQIAIARSFPKLYLQCEKHNVGFYVSQGFEPLHQATSNQFETTIMVWECK